ncbi:MAG: ribulokinase [Fidelibacterota bacterium]|nr:MAG: ribulokinase [Candidatus Neomarinimicrobiota bacterium]
MAATIGFDFGTNSVRCLIVDIATGKELGTAVEVYETGEAGVMTDPSDHNIARQNPADYLCGMEITTREALAQAAQRNPSFTPDAVVGIGVDTTGSTPLPLDKEGVPLAMRPEFGDNPNAQAWLWKDHTGYAEAAEITALAAKGYPEYLAKCGGIYSSEWFFSKILQCLRVDPAVFDAAYTWAEICDYIPAELTDTTAPTVMKRSRCAAGHKAMFNKEWGGLPSREFLAQLDPKLGALRERLYAESYTVDTVAGYLTEAWAGRLGLTAGIPVAVGAFDAHLGAIGAGVKEGTLVKIIGTSTCDVLVSAELDRDVPGICGIVDGSVLPGYWGLEAGQSAVGDIFNWFVNSIEPGGKEQASHEELTSKAALLRPGQSGLLALDWNNGNRTILVDQRLTGLLVGQTLHTRPEEIYRALVEGTAFGALAIIERFEEYGVDIQEVINCGGVSEKNEMLLQIYADVTGREMKISLSSETCALGSAIAAAVAAGKASGGFDDFEEAQSAMCHVKEVTYQPDPENHNVYQDLFRLYMQLHDAFGVQGAATDLSTVMKDLLTIKERALAEHV